MQREQQREQEQQQQEQHRKRQSSSNGTRNVRLRQATAASIGTDGSGSSDDDPDSLRTIVARETARLARCAIAARATEAAASHKARTAAAVAQAIAEQNLTASEIQEFIGLGDSFKWVKPLSRAAAITHLALNATGQQQQGTGSTQQEGASSNVSGEQAQQGGQLTQQREAENEDEQHSEQQRDQQHAGRAGEQDEPNEVHQHREAVEAAALGDEHASRKQDQPHRDDDEVRVERKSERSNDQHAEQHSEQQGRNEQGQQQLQRQPQQQQKTEHEQACSSTSTNVEHGRSSSTDGAAEHPERLKQMGGGIELQLNRPTEFFAFIPDELDGSEPAGYRASTSADEQWWQEVDMAIQADGDGDAAFDRTPTVLDLLELASCTARRRVSAKRPALPHELEARPPCKKKRPG